MTFDDRLAAAHQELASKGVWHANYNPPLFRLLRRAGLSVKPPHYQSWLTNFIDFGVSSGLIWGLFMWLVSWHGTDIAPASILRQIAIFAGFMGLAMASYLWLRRKQLTLTPWEDLGNT